MKLLEKFRKKLNPEQVLGWLRWIESTCWRNFDCQDCPLKGYPDLDGMLCRVRNIYKEINPRIDTPKYPCDWSTLSLDSPTVKPDNLNFLREIEWDGSGNPIPELKEGVK